MGTRRVVITGIGLVTSAGVGIEAHRALLADPKPVYDADRHAPYTVHPAPEIDWTEQMAKRDQRQMELWQKLGVFGAGLALDSAKMKDNLDLCSTMDMTICAAGGERDLEVDMKILNAVHDGQDRDQTINDVLTTDLRPTLFLAQLSNLLAGNISIVHKVTGSSRTFMGGEGSGISALSTAEKRIRHGQSTHALVGGSFNGEDADVLFTYELNGWLSRSGWAPVGERDGDSTLITGSGAAFLVLEEREHAVGRGATILAELGSVNEHMTPPSADDPSILEANFAAGGIADAQMVVSGTSGSDVATKTEFAALERVAGGKPIRAFTSLVGHIKEPQFVLATALAALAVSADRAPAPMNPGEAPATGPVNKVMATTVGYIGGVGSVLVSRHDGGAA